ncbi:MAG: hypothetical protein ALECFALPRED_009025 [Alectoria fallacina]|uniref:Myb-like domain-containing protein n=1 Tax=Alectoria fallacina TaxID=1903189 RepID=A0A8H3J5J8_9LECA|nr:MAG: hypothetical protein ALECFALPRED_009025 [Alectoria fallacina]
MLSRIEGERQSSNGKQHIATTMFDSGSNFDAFNHSVDASEPASESSEKSSTSSCDPSRSRGRPTKRNITETLTYSQPRLKHLKLSYTDGYRGLFNSTVKEIASNKSSETDSLLQKSQVGVTVWSPEEKEAFFRAIARRGRQNFQGIATDIGSKSESEVYLYSDMLEKAAVEQQIQKTCKKLFNTTDLEAALEVRGDCCAALDLAAGALSALQQNEEERAEKKRHKDSALLTPRIARWVERCIVAPGGGEDEVSQQIPAAMLLNLMNFLALSQRFFMNSVIAEDNWRSYTANKHNSPSIMYTAFSDFHALSISITQRLVQSSLFFAMSRLRAMSASGHYAPRSQVRRGDVMAALNVLGMKIDSKAFWARVARKCKLRVYDKVRHRQVFGKRYSYVEVERILSPSMISDPDDPEITVKDANTLTSRKGRTSTEFSASASESSISWDSRSIEADGPSALPNNEDLSAALLDPTCKQDHKQEGHDQLQDAYAEALDQQANRNEERRLWEMLGENPIEMMEPEDVKLPKGPFPNRKVKDELDDWRDWVDYDGDWETHEIPVFGSCYTNNRGFKKDVDSAAGLTSFESSSESLINDESTEEEHDSDSAEDADADGDGASNIDGASISSADDAEHGERSRSVDPDRDLRRSSLDDDVPTIQEQKGDLRLGGDVARHNSPRRPEDATNDDIESSDDDSSNE